MIIWEPRHDMLYYSEGCYNEVPVDLYAFVCKKVHESRGERKN